MDEYNEMKLKEQLNVSIPGKCACCPYMFDYKCRADECPYKNTEEK